VAFSRESLYREQRTNRGNYKVVLGQLNCGFVNNCALRALIAFLKYFRSLDCKVSLSHKHLIVTLSEIIQQPNPQVKLSIRQRKSALQTMCADRDCIILNVDTGTDANGLNA